MSAPSDVGDGPRWVALDGLRGVAILLVVIAHAHILPAVAGGMVGVTLFFVLSGFLITNLLMREVEKRGRVDLGVFYRKRALRLLPALGIYIVGISVVLHFRTTNVPILQSAWPPLLYISNYIQILGTDIFAHRHTWSLAVEEHFYLVWPVLVGLGIASKVRFLSVAVVVLVGWRIAVGFVDAGWAYMGTDTNAYALAIGALLASIHRSRGLQSLSRIGPLFALAGLALLSLIPISDRGDLDSLTRWVPIVAAALSAVVVWGAVVGASPSLLTSKTLRWFGLISYALYLWHAPLLQIPGLGETGPRRAMAVAIGIGMASLSWKFVEGPILRSRLRRRWSGNRSETATVSSSV